MSKRIELGCKGHLIVSRWCQWHRHTEVNGYRISTIGNYYPDHKKREPIGAGDDSFFETLVFRVTDKLERDNDGCGCHEVESWCELDGELYATAGEAQAGHERFVRKYAHMKAEVTA